MSVANLPLNLRYNFVMSCFTRLLGLICAVVPGLLFLAFSALFFTMWPRLGMVIGPLYSLASFVTGAVCLYLGVGILFGRDRKDETAASVDVAPQTLAPSTTIIAQPLTETKPLQAAPLPVAEVAEPVIADEVPPAAATSVRLVSDEISMIAVPAPPDSPEIRIRQLAKTRPQWRVTAPQLAHSTNLKLAVADETAREMADNGQAQIETGPNGETIYIFDLA